MNTAKKMNWNMEAKNHPIEKEHHLNQTSIFGFKTLIFRGVYPITTIQLGDF